MNSFSIFKSLSLLFPKKTSLTVTQMFKDLISMKNNHLKEILLSKGRFECDNILYKSNLTELRNDLRTVKQTEHTSLQQSSSDIQNSLSTISDELKEQMTQLKSDMQIEMENKKNEMREELTVLETKSQEVNNKLGVVSSDVKTEIERMKLDVTSSIIFRTAIALTVLALIYSKFVKKDKSK